jgi:hypothetical protein
VLWDVRIRDSALLSFLHYSNANLRGRTFYAHHLLQRQQQDKMETIRNAEFATLLQTFREQFLPTRKAVYSAWQKLAVQNGLQLVFLTQPHAYLEDFKPYQDDLRLFPVVGGKKLNLIQVALLMDEINT